MSLERIKPKALKPGSRIAIVSPASTPKVEKVQAGMASLQALGYDAVLSPNALALGPLYYAGTVAQRLDDLHAAFADANIDAILCTRGGWGSAELLPGLDANLIQANAKAFIGYSDHTSLHIWLKTFAGLGTFYGPMCAADFSRVSGVDAQSWAHTLTGKKAWTLDAIAGLRTLKAGIAEGTLDGGCLSIYTESLGTPYAANASDGVLFLEDVGVKPYQWDRMLLHLRYAGMLDKVKGIVFGDMTQCISAEEQEFMDAALLHSLRDFDGPIAIGLRSGHVDGANITLPLGISVRLDLSDSRNPRMDFREAATSG